MIYILQNVLVDDKFMIPKKVFLTRGIGKHKNKLISFELALRDAGIEKCNLVYVSSIIPPKCKIINRKEGLNQLKPGEITYCVMSRIQTDNSNNDIAAAIGITLPDNPNICGYIAEYNVCSENIDESNVKANVENISSQLLKTTLNQKNSIDFSVKSAVQIGNSNEDNVFLTAIAVAVLLGK